MPTTIEQTSGVGIHATYTVMRDGQQVAKISRRGPHSTWRIRSVHYNEELSQGAMTIAATKEIAYGLTYPPQAEIYETICQRVESARKSQMETHHRADFVRLARAIVTGSNSAHAELTELIAKIDAFAIDREDTQGRCRDTGGDFGPYEPTTRGRTFTYYPEPPGCI